MYNAMLRLTVDFGLWGQGVCYSSLCLPCLWPSSWLSVEARAVFGWHELLHFEEPVIGPGPQQVISEAVHDPKWECSWPRHSRQPSARGVLLSNLLEGPVLAGGYSDVIPCSSTHWTDLVAESVTGKKNSAQRLEKLITMGGQPGSVAVVSPPGLSQL